MKKITVTRADIKAGKPNDGHWCPIAIATKRACRARDVSVADEWPGEHVEVRGKRYLLSKSAGNFIERFDDGKPVKPFSFVLREIE